MTAPATVFTHPNIYLRASDAPVSGGIVVHEGKVVAAGTLEHCHEVAGPEANVVALPGAAVFPGFHDAHIHCGSLALQFQSPDINSARSLAEAVSQLRAWVDANPGERWVVGGRWDANKWLPQETLTRDILDDIFGDRPAVLNTVDGHSVCANSKALALAGIDESTPEMPGGVIERDAQGRLNGILRENASDFIRAVAETELLADAAPLLRVVQQHLHERGVVAVTDLDGEEVRRGFEALAAAGELRLRVRKGIPVGSLDDAIAEGRRSGQGDQWCITGSVKFYSDGALGSHTALMHEAYEQDACNCGVAVTSREHLVSDVAKANEHGIAVSTHAIGDRANTNVLDAYEANIDLTRARGLRNSIEHAQHIAPSDIERFKRLDVIASMQPTHCTSDYPLSVQLLGARETLHYPWKTLRDRGVEVVFGSDGPIEPVEPLFGIHAAVTRQRRDDEPAGGREPEERLSVAEAIEAYTERAAAMDEREAVRGAIEPGAFADFVVLAQDPFHVPPATLWQIPVAATIVAGEVVYQAEGARA